MKQIYDSIEELNKEILDLKKSKEYKVGSSLIKIGNDLVHFRLKNLLKTISDKIATIIIHKKYMSKKCFYEVISDTPDEKSKIAVYTCILGNYDNINVPLVQFENVDYFLICDDKKKVKDCPRIYKVIEMPVKHTTNGPIYANRYAKFHPSIFFRDYDYTIYLDGNVRVISDIRCFVSQCNKKTGIAMHYHRERDCVYQEAKACNLLRRGKTKKIQMQMKRYCKEGLPHHYGMHEASIIVTCVRNQVAIDLLNQWWKEFCVSESLRDQLAWPYVLWKNGYTTEDVGCLGDDIYSNYKIQLVKHK